MSGLVNDLLKNNASIDIKSSANNRKSISLVIVNTGIVEKLDLANYQICTPLELLSLRPGVVIKYMLKDDYTYTIKTGILTFKDPANSQIKLLNGKKKWTINLEKYILFFKLSQVEIINKYLVKYNSV
jgi:hypothetical protein